MGSEPRNLGALEKAVNDAAGRASNLWISFVFFATLIAITTGTVTHKHLFLELPLKLPVLNVDAEGMPSQDEREGARESLVQMPWVRPAGSDP